MQFTPAALTDIQGLILSGYGHLRYVVYLFLQIRDPAGGKAWLEKIVPQITTAERWEVGPDGEKIKPPRAQHIAFTIHGFRTIGLPEEALNSFPDDFIGGMANDAAILGDTGESAPEQWEVGGPANDEIHMLLLLRAASEEEVDSLRDEQRELIEQSDGAVVEVAMQRGSQPTSGKNPLGFRDGISEPIVQGTPGNPEPNKWVVNAGEFVLGYLNGYDLYPPSPSVLDSNDPAGVLPRFPDSALPKCRDFGRHGSFIVYRKLGTKVAEFWRYLEEQARLVPGQDAAAIQQRTILYGSKCIGRWPSGAPLVVSPSRDNPELSSENEFTYETDPKGYACPIGSHIRRANPRASLAYNPPESSFTTSNQHRIIRRASYYGPPLFDFDRLDQGEIPLDLKDDGEPRGLHFFAINANIKTQFTFIQEQWCNNARFNGLYNNKDPVIGDNDGTGHMTIDRDPLRLRLHQLPRFVYTKGGGYFFLPSITALKFLTATQ